MTEKSFMEEPEHHRRYRVAWLAHQDPDTPRNCLEELEKEMDSAQNHFGWDEFQEFKKTLPGFLAYWSEMREEMDQMIVRLFGKIAD